MSKSIEVPEEQWKEMIKTLEEGLEKQDFTDLRELTTSIINLEIIKDLYKNAKS